MHLHPRPFADNANASRLHKGATYLFSHLALTYLAVIVTAKSLYVTGCLKQILTMLRFGESKEPHPQTEASVDTGHSDCQWFSKCFKNSGGGYCVNHAQYIVCFQIYVWMLLAAGLALPLGPNSNPPAAVSTTMAPVALFRAVTILPVASAIAQNSSIPTHVVGHLEDLEVAAYVFRPLFAYRYKQSRNRGR